MTLAQKLDHYAKAIIGAAGIVVLLINQYADLIPNDAQPYVAAVVSAVTAFGIWYKANGPKVAGVINQIDRDPTT